MSGVMALGRLEIVRSLRNRRVMFFTILYPAMLFLLSASSVKGKNVPGTDIPYVDYFLVAYASFGVIAASLNNNAMRISQERKEGWIRQLRLTALPSYGYVVSKIAASLLVVIPAIVVTFLLGTTQGVKLSGEEWVSAFLVIWLGSLAFTALGIAIGYGVPQDAVQPATLIIYVAGSFLGGQFFAVSGTLETIGKALPTYWVREIATQVISGQPISWGGVAILAAWVVGCAILAAVMYQKRAED
ncbi:ABC transporter permease [Actinospica sp. MGRD01-02]|uniref:ABC transporter permease n=1 Tax=Actinospica acidithermotolerans TaxID=2828514 RepID=A0A941IL84_9ACTN|nr:ABC transporter permease [Actinospica acidithermotolerans]MBR7827381.1 ABC transporter permease [Actinospica acidithermotolerans]